MIFSELFAAVKAEVGTGRRFSIKVDATHRPADEARKSFGLPVSDLFPHRPARAEIEWSIYVAEDSEHVAVMTDDWPTAEGALAEMRVELAKLAAPRVDGDLAAVGAPHLDDDGAVRS